MLINSEQDQRAQTELFAAVSQIEDLLRPLAPRKDMAELERFRADFQRKIDDLYSESRKLNIGVVGQVKAGKSSFLNTLLFDGQEILPKAATPKTAALTRIEFGSENMAEIEYYSAEDWEAQKRRAASGLDDSVTTTAKELVQMVDERVRQGLLDVSRCLSMGTERISFSSYQDMIGKLNQYVGDDGIYTPLVKSVSLRLCDQRFDNELLRGCTIVDTPGLNDPVVSRTTRTKEFIEVCDVVFLLSRSSQFLDTADWTLLSAQLPQGGVKKLVLIGSQFDSAVRDILRKPNKKANLFGFAYEDKSHTDNVPEACRMAEQKLSDVARKKVASEQALLSQTGYNDPLVNVIGMCAAPIFFSSLACNMRNKLAVDYTNEETGLFRVLSNFSQDVSAELGRMGNIAPIRAVLDEISRDKEAILQEKSSTLLSDAKKNLGASVGSFREQTENKIKILSSNDRDQLIEKKSSVEKQQNAIKAAVSDVFSKRIDAMKKEKMDAVKSMRSASESARLDAQTGSRQVEHSYQVSVSKWYKPWTWGKKETRWYTTTETYTYLVSSDAAEHLNRYAKQSATQIEEVFLSSVNLQEMRQTLCSVVVNNMNMGDADFDANYFRKIVNELVDGIRFPLIHINTQNVVNQCVSGFDGEVRDEAAMQRLRTALHSGMAQLFHELCIQFDREADTFIDGLKGISSQFQDTLLEKLNGEFDVLLKELEQKDMELARLKDYQHKLNEAEGLLGGSL